MLKKYLPLILFFIIFSVFDAKATHFMGADITYQCIGPNLYSVSLTLYRDCGGATIGNTESVQYTSPCGSGTFNVNKVSVADITPLCPTAVSSCSGGGNYGVQEHVFTGTLNLTGATCSNIILSWSSCCRNNVINTLNSPGSNNIYVESLLNNSLSPACNSSPVFNNTPASYVCINQPFLYNHGVSDADGDSLYFSLGSCYQTATSLVTYGGGFSGVTPLSSTGGVNIDPTTGAIFFTPNTVQVGVICVIVEEFRNGVKIGEVNRDMQFNVVNCSNVSPSASGVNGTPGNVVTNFQTNICASAPLCFTIDGTDPDLDIVNMTWNGEITSATFNVLNNNTTSPQGQFCWTPTAANIGTNVFTVNVEDDNCPIIGTSTFTYVIEVLPSPNTFTLSPNAGICVGGSTVLTATTAPAATSITWSPSTGLSSTTGASVTASPTVTTTYTVSASFPDGCDIQRTVTVSILPPPSISVTPANSFNCSGSSTTLTATTSASGYNFQWFNPSNVSLGAGTVVGNSSSINVIAPNPGINNYVVQVSNPLNGCSRRDTAVITIAQPTGNVCNVLYVTPTGTAANAGTKTSPLSLDEALIRGACNGTTIKMAQGTYVINNPIITITDYITLEGGYSPITWDKSSMLGATTISRSALNVQDLTGNAPRLVAFEINNKSNFRFQDITITVANAPAATGTNKGISTYGVYMNGCSNYKMVRTQVTSGTGGAGLFDPGGAYNAAWDGANGGNANNGGTGGGPQCTCGLGTDNGGSGGAGGASGAGGANAIGLPPPSGTAGGAGGAGGVGRNDNTSGNGFNGNAGAAAGVLSGGTSGTGGSQDGNGNSSSNVGNGGAGLAGATGTNGVSIASNFLGGFYNPSYGTNGTAGTGGSGGGGGGGGARDDDGCDAAGGGGSGGGGGGGGGGGAKGATGGGSSFPVFIFNGGTGGQIIDSDLNSNGAGLGGSGGSGGLGGTRGTSTIGNGCTNGDTDGNTGGSGGFGGAGGAGGNGGSATNGLGSKIYVFGTVPQVLNNSTSLPIVAGANNPAIFNLALQPQILQDDISCTLTNMDFTTATSATWNLGLNSTPTSPTGAVVTTQYTAVGRKNIVFGANTYTGFTNILLDAGQVPTISTNAPIVNGAYKICAGTAVNFMANEGGVGYIYHWNLGGGSTPNTFVGSQYENLNNIPFNTPGVYTIQLQYETNCCGIGVAGSLVLHVEAQPNLVLPADINLCADAGVPANIVATGLTPGGHINWTLPNGLNRTDTTHVTALPSASIVYQVTMTDSSGLCVDVEDIAVNVIDLALVAATIPQGCTPNGAVSNVTVTGGSGNYSYSYLGTSITFPTPTLQNLYAGTYMVRVIDNTNGCADSIPALVGSSPATVTPFISGVNIKCFGDANDTLTANVTGGTAPYTYVWSAPAFASGNKLRNVGPGTYSVTVTDNLGCTGFRSYTVLDANPLQLSLVQNDSASCPTTLDGTLEVLADGGAGSYTYLWNTGNPADNQAILSGVGTGYYCATVTDAFGCSASVCDTMYSYPMVPINSTVNICAGDSFFAFGAWQTTSGVYTDTVFAPPVGTYLDTMVFDNFQIASIFTPAVAPIASNIKSFWKIADNEPGLAVNSCEGNVSNGNNTLFITSNLFGYNEGAVYYDQPAYASNDSVSSSNISTVGRTNITVNFDYISIGDLLNDNAKIEYSINNGVSWTVISPSLKSATCTAATGRWTFATFALPANAANIANLRFRFKWVNNGSNTSVRTSIAVDNFYVTGVAPLQAAGCDTLRTVNLIVNPVYNNPVINAKICQSQTYTLPGGSVVNVEGIYKDTLTSVSGCDSILTTNLMIDSFMVRVIDTTICQGQTLTVNGVVYANEVANALDTAFYTVSGCDSIRYNITLKIDSVANVVIDTTICQGQTLTVNGVVYSSNVNNVLDTSYYPSGCDSLRYNITLHIDSFDVIVIDTTICQGEILTVNGFNYTANGIYFDTLRYAASGCDSLRYEITLHIDSVSNLVIDTTICQGQTLTINGMLYTTEVNNVLDTAFYNISGCDSIRYDITMRIDSFSNVVIDTTICQGQTITVNGVVYANEVTNALDTAFYTASGCDSLRYNITLHIDSVSLIVIDTAICQGETLTVNGIVYANEVTNALDTAFYTVTGCDSIRYNITLKIDSVSNVVIDTTICQGQTLTVNGVVYANEVTNALDTAFYAVSGCDSIRYDITLHIDSVIVTTQNFAICQGDSVVVDGTSYTLAGSYIDTMRYALSGCDSFRVVTNIIVNPTYNDTVRTSVCVNDLYTLPDGTTTNLAGTYPYTDTTTLGCDSLYTVVLTITPLPTGTATAAICIGDSVFLGNAWQNTAGSYIDTVANGANCDSIVTTTLTINALPNVTANASASALCQGDLLTLTGGGASTYVWTNGAVNNVAFAQAVGNVTYIVTGTDANTCIDTASVTVRVNPTYSSINNVAICEDALPYTFPDGTSYNTNTNTTNTSTFNTVNNCDSVIITNLTVNQNGTFGTIPDTIAVCESFNVQINMTALNMQTYQWQLNDGSGFVNLTDAGIYSGTNTNELTISPLDISLTGNIYRVVMVDECGTGGYQDETYLRVSMPHDVIDPIDDLVRCLEDSSLIYVDYNGYNYVWNNGQTGQFLRIEGSGTYSVTFTENLTNCEMSDEFDVLIEDCIENCVVLAPTGFSPQASNGKNDIFRVMTSCDEGFTFFEFRVYNRWGEMVYMTKDPTEGWDGKYKNENAEIGVYVYYLEYNKKGQNKKQSAKGQVTLVR